MDEKLLGKCGFYCGACPTYIKGGCLGCEEEHTEGDCFTRDCVKVIKGLGKGRMVIQENDRMIGECNYRNVADGIAEIGIKICENDWQNRGVGRKVLSMLIGWLFRNVYSKIVLDTNLTNTRAQHVYYAAPLR